MVGWLGRAIAWPPRLGASETESVAVCPRRLVEYRPIPADETVATGARAADTQRAAHVGFVGELAGQAVGLG